MTAETEPELFGHLVAFKSSSCSKELYTITSVIPPSPANQDKSGSVNQGPRC